MAPERFELRPAAESDAAEIRRLVRKAGINPSGLKWPRFTVVEGPAGEVAACGQLKPHADGSVELASLVVRQELRGRGLARRVMEALLKRQPGELYLMCRSDLGPLYEKFGFHTVPADQMPPYFRRVKRLVGLFEKVRGKEMLLVMRRKAGAS